MAIAETTQQYEVPARLTDSQGRVAVPDAATFSRHPAGCMFGGFSCEYWLVAENCDLRHPAIHKHGPLDPCPLGL